MPVWDTPFVLHAIPWYQAAPLAIQPSQGDSLHMENILQYLGIYIVMLERSSTLSKTSCTLDDQSEVIEWLESGCVTFDERSKTLRGG